MPNKGAWNLTDEARGRIREMRAENQSAAQILAALKGAGIVPETATDRGMRYHLTRMKMGGRRASAANTGVKKRAARPARVDRFGRTLSHLAGTKFEPLWTPAANKLLEREWNKGTALVEVKRTLEQSGTLARRKKLGFHSLYSQAFRLRKAGRPIVNRGRGVGATTVSTRTRAARSILDAPIPARGHMRYAPGNNGERVPVILTSAQAARLVEFLLGER